MSDVQDDLKKLYDMSVVRNIMAWNDAIMPSQDTGNASRDIAISFVKQLNEFYDKHPEHPITKFYIKMKVSPELSGKIISNEAELWKEYIRLRKNKDNASEAYFDMFDEMIALRQESCKELGWDNTEYFRMNDYNLGSTEVIKAIIKRMADISRELIDSGMENNQYAPDIIVKDYSKLLSDLNETLEEDGVQRWTSTANGSFMTAIDTDTVRIHISTDSDEDMYSSTSHEYGHALYQRDILNRETEVGKLGGCFSLALHETASISFENMFDAFEKTVSDNPNKNITRLTSDKLHYIIHIHIRMTIEDMLMTGEIVARDIPDVWKNLVKEYIGYEVQTDWDGFLQDVHWSGGAIGYFHSYAIGFFNSIVLVDGHEPKQFLEEVLKPFNENSTNIIETLHPDLEKSFQTYRENLLKIFRFKK